MGVGVKGISRTPTDGNATSSWGQRLRRSQQAWVNSTPMFDEQFGVKLSDSGIWGLGPTVPYFHTKITKTFTDISAALNTNDISLFSLPAGGFIEMVKIKHSVAFTGGGLTGLTLSVGPVGFLDKYSELVDVFQAVSDTTYCINFLPGSEDHGSATDIRLSAVSTGGFIDNATQGSADIWVKYAEAIL